MGTRGDRPMTTRQELWDRYIADEADVHACSHPSTAWNTSGTVSVGVCLKCGAHGRKTGPYGLTEVWETDQ